MAARNTQEEFETVLAHCRDVFMKKMHDYGTAWRLMRPSSITDQIFIKASRIRSLQEKRVAMVDEGIAPEFTAIVNYSIMGMIQLELGATVGADLSDSKAAELYDSYAQKTLELMLRKNHDYDEAWRAMRVSSYADLILMKVFRTKQIEDLAGQTLVSEGISANYADMMNYAVFGLIKLTLEDEAD
ncbi:MAG: DUF1599 domain-containing protein [Alloprevotella sp.]